MKFLTARNADNIVYNFFIIWACVGVLTLLANLHPLPWWIRWADAFFIVLGAANTLLSLAARDGWRAALTGACIIIAGSGAVEWIGATTGQPFGSYEYVSDRFGWRIFGVLPFTIPLAWFTILGCGHSLACLIFRTRPRLLCALVTAVIATGLDWVMEPFAWLVKGYWVWNTPAVPVQNYAAWFTTSLLLTLCSPWGGRPISRFDPRPAVVLGAMLVTFIIGRLRHGV